MAITKAIFLNHLAEFTRGPRFSSGVHINKKKNLNLTPKEAVKELSGRLSKIRENTIQGMGLNDLSKRAELGLTEKDHFSPEFGFIFNMGEKDGMYQDSDFDGTTYMFERAGVGKGKKLFDLGTGLGSPALLAAVMGAKVFSVEISTELCEIAENTRRLCSDLPGVRTTWILNLDYRNPLLESDLKETDYFHVFLPPELVQEAIGYIEGHAKPGAILFASSNARLSRETWELSKEHLGYVKKA